MGRHSNAISPRLYQLAADESGVAAVEFALLLPLLATILLATADLAALASRSFEAQSLAHAAANAIARLPTIPPAPSTAGQPSPGAGSLPGGFGPSATSMRQALPPINTANFGLPQVEIASLVDLPAGTDASGELFWGCNQGGQLLSVQTALCPDGGRAAPYVEVFVRASVNRLVAWPDQLLSQQVEARAVVRLG